MVKYIRREREGAKLEYYYNEFVKRDWYKDKNLYDRSGRRIRFDANGTKISRTPSRVFLDDPDFASDSEDQTIKGNYYCRLIIR